MTWDYYNIKKKDFRMSDEKADIDFLITRAVNIGLRNSDEILREVNSYPDFEFTKKDVDRAAEIIANAISNYIYKW